MMNKENSMFTVLASLLVGLGFATAFYVGIISVVSALFYITLIVGILSLILIVFLFGSNRTKGCFCTSECLIASALGSIISSLLALTATTLIAGSFATAAVIGVVAFFLASNLIYAILTIICLICTRRKCE